MMIIHDERLPSQYIKVLAAKFPEAELYPFSGPKDAAGRGVYPSILSHPDIYFCQLDGNTLVHAPCVPEEGLEPLRRAGVNLIRGEKDPEDAYPGTARYNAARVGDLLFHNLRSTDSIILEEARKKRLKCIDVKQGYSRCSILALGKTAIITSDAAIAGAAGDEGLDTLLVSPLPVILPGEKHGFLGGAAGISPEKEVIVLGDIGRHPQAQEVMEFAARNRSKLFYMKGLPIYDAGSLIFLDIIRKR